ncbi:hypothetical protein SLS58_005367 [Diplodia intermedia]|uniref:Heterokaryon incompatibility domain-containing protein n=1 Tax=Diplodia intermedia TaxID=856260 RepID=A0ABR3TRF2_9PEZI
MKKTKTTYHYEPLSNSTTQFRLLKLLPGKDDEELKCKLEVHFRRSSGKGAATPSYCAISYVWGPELETPPTIRCHERRVEIQPSLEDALRRLREKSGSQYLWTDAICIDQGNEDEKKSQILEMGSVYQDATKVYVWLGTNDREDAFTLMNHLGDRMERDDDKFRKAAENCRSKQWEALSKLLKNDWFERVWTLQEICLASRGLVMSGINEVEWARFVSICRRLHATCRKLRHKHDLRFYRVLRTDVDFRTGHEGPGYLLKLVRTRKCKEPIDRIRGILGHNFFRQFQRDHGHPFIRPEYLRTEITEFDHEVTQQLLKLPEPLYILSLVQQEKDKDKDTMCNYTHPSWVPRFKQGTDVSTLADETKRDGSWNAGGKSTLGRLFPQQNVLDVKGVEVDSIEWQSEKITNRLKNGDSNDLVKSIWQKMKEVSGDKKKEKDLFREFCEIFYLENHFSNRERSQESYPDTNRQMAHCLAYFADNKIDQSCVKRLRNKYPDGIAEEFFPDVLHHCRNRRFVVTQKKGYLGLAPEVSRASPDGKGDKSSPFPTET